MRAAARIVRQTWVVMVRIMDLPKHRETVIIKVDDEGDKYTFAGYYDGDIWFALFPDDEGCELCELHLNVVSWKYLDT